MGWGDGGYDLESQNPKCQDLPKFLFFGWGGEVIWKVQTQSAKICLDFNFRGGGGWVWGVGGGEGGSGVGTKLRILSTK